MNRPLGVLFFLACVTFFGCGGNSGPATHPVTGKVMLDGKPLPEGTITFEAIPADGRAPATGPITNGEFSLKATAGKHTVRISRVKMVKTPMGDTSMDIATETLPAKFNTASTLSREVAAGPNSFDFTLKSR